MNNNKLKYDLLLRDIRDTAIYLTELSISRDIDKLNLYRIFLNKKIMDAVKLKKKINDDHTE